MDNETKKLFDAASPVVGESYQRLMKAIADFGAMRTEPKKTSIHVLNKSAFLGVHPKKNWLDLNIVTDIPLESPRVLRTEQISKNRFHNLVRLSELKEVDAELVEWLKQAYQLKS